jgi:osmotically-inducible protein OsmY
VRSDERIREQVCEALTDHDGIDARDVEVNVQGGEVTLSGSVPERAMKRYAEMAAENCRGVKDVHNQLRVKQDESRNGPVRLRERSPTQT